MTANFQSIVANTTPLHRALEHVFALGVDRMDANAICHLRDPWRCPAKFLHVLAFELSVDVWNDKWPELKKREAIAKSLRLHRMKGTEQGLRDAIELAGGKLLRIVTPPAKTYLAPDTTSEQRAEFLSRYAQLRIYPRRSRGEARGLFAGTKRAFVERHNPVPSTAFFRAQPRSFIWDNGKETELSVVDMRHETITATNEERLDLRMRGRRRNNHYAPFAKMFALKSTASRRIFSVHTRQTLNVPGEDRLARRLVHPSITPINVVAEMVRQRGTRRTATAGRAFASASRFYGFLQASRARERVYRRTYIYDPARPPRTRGARTFLGSSSRLGMPAHNAEITVQVRYPKLRFAFGSHVAGFVLHRPKTELALVKEAIRTHKRLSDRILINTKTVAAVTAGVQRRAGQLYAGQIVETI